MQKSELKVEHLFRKNGGTMRTAEALRAGIHQRTLYAMRNQGELIQVSRGVFRLADLGPISNPDLVTVALRIPNAVICLISALSFHEITTQIPHEVSIALKKGDETPRIEHPPIVVHRFSADSYKMGIEEHVIDGIKVKIYSPEKTLVDCFKFRNKVGKDVAIEALQFYKARKKLRIDSLLQFARICRVENVMRPYLEAIL
jgi:predicted transcriptional regulator of viral defense system